MLKLALLRALTMTATESAFSVGHMAQTPTISDPYKPVTRRRRQKLSPAEALHERARLARIRALED